MDKEAVEGMAQKIYGYVLKNIEPFAVIVPMPWEKLTPEAKDYWHKEAKQILALFDKPTLNLPAMTPEEIKKIAEKSDSKYEWHEDAYREVIQAYKELIIKENKHPKVVEL